MTHLLTTAMIPIQPGSPAAHAFLVLASLTAIAAVVVIVIKARTWLRENDTDRRSSSGDGSTAALGGYTATDSSADGSTDSGSGADGGGGGCD